MAAQSIAPAAGMHVATIVTGVRNIWSDAHDSMARDTARLEERRSAGAARVRE